MQRKSLIEALRLTRRLLLFLAPHRRGVGLLIVLVALSALVPLAPPLLIGKVFDQAVLDASKAPEERTRLLVSYGAAILLLELVVLALTMAKDYRSQAFNELIIYDARAALFDKAQRLSPAFHDRMPTGALLSRVLDETRELGGLVRSALSTILLSPITFAGVIVMMLLMNPLLTAFALLPAPLMYLTLYQFVMRIRAAMSRLKQTEEKMSAFVVERMSAVATVQVLGQESAETERFRERQRERLKASLDMAQATARYYPMLNFLMSASVLVALLYGGFLSIDRNITGGQIVSFLAYLAYAQAPLMELTRAHHILQGLALSSERIFEILDAPQSVPDGRDEAPEAHSLELRGVTFAYPGGPRVISELSHTFSGTVGITGPSGCGKSTLAKLLVRLYDPDAGEIRFGDRNVRDLTLASLRRRVTLVPQDDVLFDDTVLNNLMYGSGSLDARSVAEKLGADEFIRRLPNGYETVVGERGHRLSLGERQRLFIARAVLRNPCALILDEATSGLDSENEQRVLSAVRELLPHALIIIISHRSSALSKCDRVLELNAARP